MYTVICLGIWINYTSDQCNFKGTQMPMKFWDPVFRISDKGYYKKSKIGNPFFFGNKYF